MPTSREVLRPICHDSRCPIGFFVLNPFLSNLAILCKSLGVTFFSKFYNPNLHNIPRSDRIGFKTKNPHEWIPTTTTQVNWLLICCVGELFALSTVSPPPFKSIGCVFAAWVLITIQVNWLYICCVGELFALTGYTFAGWDKSVAWIPTTI